MLTHYIILVTFRDTFLIYLQTADIHNIEIYF